MSTYPEKSHTAWRKPSVMFPLNSPLTTWFQHQLKLLYSLLTFMLFLLGKCSRKIGKMPKNFIWMHQCHHTSCRQSIPIYSGHTVYICRMSVFMSLMNASYACFDIHCPANYKCGLYMSAMFTHHTSDASFLHTHMQTLSTIHSLNLPGSLQAKFRSFVSDWSLTFHLTG